MNVRTAARRIANYSVQLDIFDERKYALEPSKFSPIEKQKANERAKKVYDILMTSGSRKWYETTDLIVKCTREDMHIGSSAQDTIIKALNDANIHPIR